MSAYKLITSLAKDVLQPSAQLIGQELKGRLKATIDERKANKRAENLKRHLDWAARTGLPEGTRAVESDLLQLELFTDWMEGAQDVDESDAELCSIWRRLLLNIVTGESTQRELLNKVRQLDGDAARLLLRFWPVSECSSSSSTSTAPWPYWRYHATLHSRVVGDHASSWNQVAENMLRLKLWVVAPRRFFPRYPPKNLPVITLERATLMRVDTKLVKLMLVSQMGSLIPVLYQALFDTLFSVKVWEWAGFGLCSSVVLYFLIMGPPYILTWQGRMILKMVHEDPSARRAGKPQ